MRKTVLIVMTIAILGALGLYIQKKPSDSLGSGSGSTASTLTANTSTPSGSTTSSSGTSSSSQLKDGTYQGSTAETPYGPVQIAVIVSGGKITDVNFIQMPSDQGHSREVTAYAEPLLKQNTIQAQSPRIDFVSGATSTSEGYEQSLQAALNRAAA